MGYIATFCLQLGIGIVGLSTYCIISTFFIGICAYVHTSLTDNEDQLQILFAETTDFRQVTHKLKETMLLHGHIYG